MKKKHLIELNWDNHASLSDGKMRKVSRSTPDLITIFILERDCNETLSQHFIFIPSMQKRCNRMRMTTSRRVSLKEPLKFQFLLEPTHTTQPPPNWAHKFHFAFNYVHITVTRTFHYATLVFKLDLVSQSQYQIALSLFPRSTCRFRNHSIVY